MTQDQTPAVVQNTSAATAPISIKETVLAQFKEAEATITTLAAKYANVAYAVTTPKGMKEAVAARADLRDNGRLFVTKAEARVKTEVNDLKRIMADEVTRLVAIVKPVEDSIDAQIKAEENRKAEEKAKRDREEATRIAAHRANIEKIKGYVSLAQGHPIEVIDHGAETLADMSFGPEWEEFAAEAAAARDAAVENLNKMIANERQRLENERLQKELADAREALALIAAAKEKAESEARAEQAKAEREHAAKVESERIQREQAEQAQAARIREEQAAFDKQEREEIERIAKLNTTMVVEAAPAITHEATVAVMPATVRQAMAPKAAPIPEPDLKLGQISERLGFTVTADFLHTLGFDPAKVDRASKLFHSEDFPAICQALIDHIAEVQEQFEAVAA